MNHPAPDGFPPSTDLPEPINAWLLAIDQTWTGREIVVNAVAAVVRGWMAGEVPSREDLGGMLAALEADLQAAARCRAAIQRAMLEGNLDALKDMT